MWYDDRPWVEAAEATAKFAGHHLRCFGPQEFVPFIEGLLPLEYSECQDDVTFFVCPKDDADLLSTKVIDRLDTYTCVCG